MRFRIIMLALVLLGGCVWGTPISRMTPAHSPAGATVLYALAGSSQPWKGELFAVDEQYAYVYNGTLYRIAWESIRRFGIDQAGGEFLMFTPAEKTSIQRARFKPFSRFPQGMSPELLAEVLRQLNQARIEEPQ